MSGSYKITLMVAAGLFIFIVGYWSTRDDPTAPPRPSVADIPPEPNTAASLRDPDYNTPSTPVAVDEPAAVDATDVPAVIDQPQQQTPPAPPKPQTYTVQASEDFPGIAQKLYGDKVYWSAIAYANPTLDPIALRAGQEIVLPNNALLNEAKQANLPIPTKDIIYTTRPGDSYWSIAQHHYHDGSKWRYIFNANRAKLGNDPNALASGVTIRIPPLPTGSP